MAESRPWRRPVPVSVGHIPAAEPPYALTIDSDVLVILTALLYIDGLAGLNGCARSRRGAGGTISAASSGSDAAVANKKGALMALTKLA